MSEIIRAKRTIALLASLLAAVVVLTAAPGTSDADSKNKKVVIGCVANRPCSGNSANNTLTGSAGSDKMHDNVGKDTFIGNDDGFSADGKGDVMKDTSRTTNDTYKGYTLSTTELDFIIDSGGGSDVLDLRPLSTDEFFGFEADDIADSNGFNRDGDGKVDAVVSAGDFVVVISDFCGRGGTAIKLSDEEFPEGSLCKEEE